MANDPDEVQAIHACEPFWEHRHHTTATTRICTICGARLRRDNRKAHCDCHQPDYRPQCAPDARERLLTHFQLHLGQVVHPLPEVFGMAVWTRSERDWLHGEVRRLRRRGHRIEGIASTGGYRYCGNGRAPGGRVRSE